MQQNELMHYGVLGMKWGKRKAKSYDPTATVKKSFKTKQLERLADSGQKHAKTQDDLYKHTGNKYHKQSADQWRRESAANKQLAEASYKRDVFNKTANRKQKKEQKAYDKARSDIDNKIEAYNRAADYANKVLIPKINKKYSKIIKTKDWTQDPNYDKYVQEYETAFSKIADKKLEEIIGRNPYNV